MIMTQYKNVLMNCYLNVDNVDKIVDNFFTDFY